MKTKVYQFTLALMVFSSLLNPGVLSTLRIPRPSRK